MKKKLCYIDTASFTVDIKTEHICSNIAKYVETRIDTKNYKLLRPLPKLKINKVIYLMKVELREKIRICCIKNKNMQLFNRQQ